MRRFTAEVPLRDPSGSTRGVVLEGTCESWSEQGLSRTRCRLTLETPAVSADAVGDDFFDAFCRLREKLNADDYWFVCYGASANFAFSGMARDMSWGMTGYLYHAHRAPEIVDVLATGPRVQPVTVAEQDDFRRRAWLKGHPADSAGPTPPASSSPDES